MGSLLGFFWLLLGPLEAPLGAYLAALGVSWGEALKLDDFGTPLGMLLGTLIFFNGSYFRV